jgi:xanthine dehydrogenase accessory factor
VALARGAGYVGAIGSRGTRRQRDARLREASVSDEQLARISGPIGLDIGAQTPEEIALAILAEIVAVGHGQRDSTRRPASPEE